MSLQTSAVVLHIAYRAQGSLRETSISSIFGLEHPLRHSEALTTKPVSIASVGNSFTL